MFRRSDAHPVWNHNRLNEPHTEVRWRTNDEEEGDEATWGNVAIFCFIIIIIIIIGYGLCVVCCMIELCNYLSIWWHHCDDLIQISPTASSVMTSEEVVFIGWSDRQHFAMLMCPKSLELEKKIQGSLWWQLKTCGERRCNMKHFLLWNL